MASDPSHEHLHAALSRWQFMVEINRRLFKQSLTYAIYTPLVMGAILAFSYGGHKQLQMVAALLLICPLTSAVIVSYMGSDWQGWLLKRARWHSDLFAAIAYIPPDPYRDPIEEADLQPMPTTLRIAFAFLRGVSTASRNEMEVEQAREANFIWSRFLRHYFGVCLVRGKLPLPQRELSRILGETVAVASIVVPLTVIGLWLFPDLGISSDWKSEGVIQGMSLLFAMVWLTYTSCRIELQRLSMTVALTAHLARMLGVEPDLPELNPPPSKDRPQPWA